MITYRFDPKKVDMKETVDGEDVEFSIQIKEEVPFVEAMKRVQHYFESNNDFTDVLYYQYPDHEYKIIVRKEHYAEFVCELLKHRLLVAAEWRNEASE